MTFSASEHEFMARALRLAKRGLYTTDPNPRVGCVLVKDDRIVGEGWHVVAGGPHAEINAINDAGAVHARGATAYVTLEPCCYQGRTPPCTDALIKAGIARVIVAMEDPNPRVTGKGLQALKEAGNEIESGLLEQQAKALNPGYIQRMRGSRPFVRSKLAMSLDGRTAMADGDSKWITSPAAREDVHRLRARSSAIMTGISTVLNDDPSLTVRAVEVETQPMRVVIDTHLSMPLTARMLSLPGRTLVMTCRDQDGDTRLQQAGAEVIYMTQFGASVDLVAVLEYLAQQEVNEVLLEAGATLSGAMLKAGLIDEIVIYMAPILMGDSARSLFNLPQLKSMDQRIELDIIEQRAVGKDWRITARVIQKQN